MRGRGGCSRSIAHDQITQTPEHGALTHAATHASNGSSVISTVIRLEPCSVQPSTEHDQRGLATLKRDLRGTGAQLPADSPTTAARRPNADGRSLRHCFARLSPNATFFALPVNEHVFARGSRLSALEPIRLTDAAIAEHRDLRSCQDLDVSTNSITAPKRAATARSSPYGVLGNSYW